MFHRRHGLGWRGHPSLPNDDSSGSAHEPIETAQYHELDQLAFPLHPDHGRNGVEMPAEFAITWMKITTSMSGPLPPETKLWLRSSGLNPSPTRYNIYRVNPKPWWKVFGEHTLEPTQTIDAIPLVGAPQDPGGVYRSVADWGLGGPNKQTGRADFQAWTDSDTAYSGIMSSAYVWVATAEQANSWGWQAGGDVATTGIGKVRADISGKISKKQKYKVRAPLDPDVQIRVLQGPAVLSYLEDADAEISELNKAIGGATIDLLRHSGYFEATPLEESLFKATIGPDAGFDVDIELPEAEGLRAALAVEVRDNDDDALLARSNPLFVTNVGDRLVLTDLTSDLLRDQPFKLLTEFVQYASDVESLAAARNQAIDDTWRELVAATTELGAGSVGDAAAFVATTGQALTPVPAGAT